MTKGAWLCCIYFPIGHLERNNKPVGPAVDLDEQTRYIPFPPASRLMHIANVSVFMQQPRSSLCFVNQIQTICMRSVEERAREEASERRSPSLLGI